MNNKQKDTQEITEQLLELEKDSFLDLDFVEELSKEPLLSGKQKERIAQVKKRFGKDFYPKVIWTITQKAYDPSKAEDLWGNTVKHKKELNDKVGRDVGISVATLDYLQNILDDLSEPKVLEANEVEKMAETALTDELTRLHLRSVFDVLLKKNINEFKRYNRPVSLIMADIDDFKKLNDRYGHQKGDEVLKAIGAIFIKNVRDTDIATRYGGEELAVILPQTGGRSAYDLAERLRILVSKEFKGDLAVTISLGVANCPQNASSADALIKAADEALYSAKTKGKNQVVIAG
jgi:diguanylate cyclase (GGDEF)-like protein